MIDSIGSRLKQLRVNQNLRQEQVADMIGVNKKQISAYENDSRQPSYDILMRLAALYHVSTDYILGCQTNRSIDVSGLTSVEVALISELVADMTAKNLHLEDK